MKANKYLLIVAVIICFIGCSHKKVYKSLGAWNEAPEKSLKLSVRSVKAKKTKYDILVLVENDYPFAVVIPENSLTLEVSGDRASGPNPRWVLKPGETASSLIKFQTADSEDGAPTLSLLHIYQGVDTVVSGVNSTESTTAGAIGGRHIAVGMSKTNGNSERYLKKSSIEGSELPPVKLVIAD